MRLLEAALKEEEVNFGPSFLGQTWGYVRHCNRGTGTVDLLLYNNLSPLSICHLMHKQEFYTFSILALLRSQGVAYFCPLFTSHCLTAL